ncbi:DUF3784 domain-containing protein [Solibacillus sp. CAU 1738]|uniref:DUF3784 domain-containing protein n=1 Tax=Solibacillus sp. CAU 1738 TaxID=3140363 RepID=UPI003261B5FF
MDPEIIGGFIICLFVGIGIILAGWLIWKKEYYHLIAGFDASTFKGDTKALGKMFGISMYILGFMTILLPFGLEFIGEWLGIAYAALTIILIIFLIVRANQLK